MAGLNESLRVLQDLTGDVAALEGAERRAGAEGNSGVGPVQDLTPSTAARAPMMSAAMMEASVTCTHRRPSTWCRA